MASVASLRTGCRSLSASSAPLCAGALSITMVAGSTVAGVSPRTTPRLVREYLKTSAPHHLVVCNANLVTDGHDDSHVATALTTHDPGGALPDRRPSAGAADWRLSQVSSTPDGHNATISVVLASSKCSWSLDLTFLNK